MENKMFFELPVGLVYGGSVYNEVELMRTNGVAEKIITKRIPDKPYTWQANVLCAAIKRIGPFEIGKAVREEYVKDQTVTIPDQLLHLSLADVNTLLVEIHRRVWKSPMIKAQEILCKMCAKVLKGDIDLTKVDFRPEDKAFMATNPDLSKILVYLKTGFELGETTLADDEMFKEYRGQLFNKMIYRPPLLKDALTHEKYLNDGVEFWRRIAVDCTEEIFRVMDGDTVHEKVVGELPQRAWKIIGKTLYDLVLDTDDLAAVREELQEYLPTLPFLYTAPCGCDKAYEIPYTMEATNFF